MSTAAGNMVRLSKRLEMSARMAGRHRTVADVGCDHAHTGIWLIQNGAASHCIGMDVRSGPLQKASENLALYGCSDRVELRLSDGLEALLPGESETVIIAGMGGIVMRGILEGGLGSKGHLKKTGLELILQPQSHIYEVRSWLYANGYVITDEDMCFEDGKYYFSMKAVEGLYFGPVLLKKQDSLFKQYLAETLSKAKRRLSQIGEGNSSSAGEKKTYFENIVRMIGEFTWIMSK